MSRIAGIVLAGVHRWGESDFDRLLPRPLMPVAHTPLICHVIQWLRRAGVHSIGICANSTSRLVRRLLADGSTLGVDLEYYEDWTPRGPAGCARDVAERLDAERFIVIDATILPDCDPADVLRAHAASGAALTVTTTPETPDGGGATTRLAPVGIYVLERDVLRHVPATGYQDMKEVLVPRLHAAGVTVGTHALPNPCPRLTDDRSYLALNAWVLERLLQRDVEPAGYRRLGHGFVHETAYVTSAERLLGPFLIGAGTTIMADATLVGPVTIGSDCVVESAAVVSRSVLWDRCHIGGQASVDRCVLGDDVRLMDGAQLYRAARRVLTSRRRAGVGATPGPLEAQPAATATPARPWTSIAQA